MKKNITLAVLSASALMGSGVASAQYIYQDLRGQLMRFTGTFVSAGNVDVDGVSIGSLDSTVITEVPPLGTNTSTVTYQDPSFFTFNNTGPADDSTLTYSEPLGTATIGTQVITLPTLNFTGSYNRNTGDLDLVGTAAALAPINTTISGYAVTLNISASSITYIGDTLQPLPYSAVIVNTQPAPLNITFSGTVNLGFPLGNQPLTFPGLSLQYTQWTLTAVPGPSALAVFLPGMFGGLIALKKRTKKRMSEGVGFALSDGGGDLTAAGDSV